MREAAIQALEIDPIQLGPDIPERLVTRICETPDHQKADAHFFHVIASYEVIYECLRLDVADPAADPFFESGNLPVGAPLPWAFSARIGAVADTLFLLRREPGFRDFCRRLLKQNLKSAFAECFAARMFKESGFSLEAKPETGVKTEDYDFTATKGAERINVEVTRLDDDHIYESQKLRRRLSKERDQLPRDAPSAIFCSVPTAWFHDDAKELQDQLVADAKAFFRGSHRVNAIVFLAETHIPIDPDNRQGQLMFEFLPVANLEPVHWSDELVFLFDGSATRSKRASLGDDIASLRTHTEFYEWAEMLRTKGKA